MMKIEKIKTLAQHSGSRQIPGPIVVKVIKDSFREDKTMLISDETGAIELNLKKTCHIIIRPGAVLRFFCLTMESGHLHFTETSHVDTANKIAQKEVMDLEAELDPWFTTEVIQIFEIEKY